MILGGKDDTGTTPPATPEVDGVDALDATADLDDVTAAPTVPRPRSAPSVG